MQVSAKDIHTLNLSGRYTQPIIDQKMSAKKTKEAYYASYSEKEIDGAKTYPKIGKKINLSL